MKEEYLAGFNDGFNGQIKTKDNNEYLHGYSDGQKRKLLNLKLKKKQLDF